MQRRDKRKPWFRAFDGWWYGQVGKGHARKQVRLVEGKAKEAAAKKRLKQLLQEHTGTLAEVNAFTHLKKLFLLFLKRHSKKKCSPETHAWYRYYLRLFARKYGTLRVKDLKPSHVVDWLDGKAWVDTTRNRAVTCLKRPLNWAVRLGMIDRSPLEGLEKDPIARRERILSTAEKGLILSSVRGCFKTFLFALFSTGARPKEIRTVEAGHFHASGLWVFPPRKHKTGKKTGRPRVIYLTPAMTRLCARLATLHPEGPLFRNSRGKPWTKDAVVQRMDSLRQKFPDLRGVTAYCARHTFTTEGLMKGVSLAEMQELLGHASPTMIAEHYGHLGQQVEFMREAAAKATRLLPREKRA